MDDIVDQAGHRGYRRSGDSTSDEFGFFTILLSVAGNETTRNATLSATG